MKRKAFFGFCLSSFLTQKATRNVLISSQEGSCGSIAFFGVLGESVGDFVFVMILVSLLNANAAGFGAVKFKDAGVLGGQDFERIVAAELRGEDTRGGEAYGG